MDLLRFFTAGSVDDGKSTLIGRLLYDSGSLFQDQLDYLNRQQGPDGKIDFSLLTDGLKDEIEQGITIDVAYRYFSTKKRKFIIADSPGHLQYTRNMMTAASTAGLGVFVVDAERGIKVQTKRHLYLASLMRVPRAVICINKIDRVNYAQEIFDEMVKELKDFCKDFTYKRIQFIPVSALIGDMVVERGNRLNWYKGKTLLDTLETIVTVSTECRLNQARMIVQNVMVDKGSGQSVRHYAGRMLSGTIKDGDEVIVYPSESKARVQKLSVGYEDVDQVTCPLSISVRLDSDIDIARGSLLVNADAPPRTGSEFEAHLCCVSNDILKVGDTIYTFKMLSREYRAKVVKIIGKVDVNELKEDSATELKLNDIARVIIKTSQPIYYDSYSENRENGSFILINEGNNNVIGAGTIIDEEVMEGKYC